jgi:hypothetical protein
MRIKPAFVNGVQKVVSSNLTVPTIYLQSVIFFPVTSPAIYRGFLRLIQKSDNKCLDCIVCLMESCAV